MRARGTWLATAVFVSLAIATTGVVRATGRSIVDTGRYQEYAESMRSDLVPYRDFDVEYPPGALALFLAPALVTSDDSSYFWAFAGLMAVAGGLGVLLTGATLERLQRPPRARRRVLVYVAGSPVVFGSVLLTRFDLVAATSVVAATLALVAGRPRMAAVGLGLGTAVKLYPLLLLPLLTAWVWRQRGRREALLAVALTLGVVALAFAPFVWMSPDGVASSIWRQVSRPLQIESLGAGFLVVLDHTVDLGLVVETSFGSQNLTGVSAGAVAGGLSLLGLAALVWLWLAFARSEPKLEELVRLSAAVVVAFVAFSKVLSPQFLVWLLFPIALVGGQRGGAARACFAVAAVATAVWFPWLYLDLPRELDLSVALLVVLRGLALVAVVAILAWPTRGPQSSLRPRAAAAAAPAGGRRPTP